MEATAKAEGQVRRLHIVYFLSHMGHIEHPHLIRIHHLNNTGVYLRDIKKWLENLRGKHMAEAFCWSYKRRYKSGYVWQDLTDDGDLVTPISDNEYVLKGSQIIPNATLGHTDVSWHVRDIETGGQPSMHHIDSSLEQFSESDHQYSSERSSLTADESIPKDEEGVIIKKKVNTDDSDESLLKSKSPSSKSKSNSIFHNLLSCGAVDTKDSAQVMLNKASRSSNGDICKRGESARSRTQKQKTTWDSKKEAGFGSGKAVSAAYRPVGEPSCSQCGKPFKPEKLHSHMKSCQGMRSNAKRSSSSTSAAFVVKKTPINSSNQESVTRYFLTS